MANYSPLCERCIKRLVDCERFYQEMVEQCDDYADDDFDSSAKVANVTSSYDPFSPDMPTGLPNVTHDEEPIADIIVEDEEPDSLEISNPIDNSSFFAHFFSNEGRIGRIQYLVHIIIALVAANIISFLIGYFFPFSEKAFKYAVIFSSVFLVITLYCAGAKRAHDSGLDEKIALFTILPAFPWFNYESEVGFVSGIMAIIVSICFFLFLLFKKGEEGVNLHGTEPLKKVENQVQSQNDEKPN